MYAPELLLRGRAGIVLVDEPPGFAEAEKRTHDAWEPVCSLPTQVLTDFGYEQDGKRSGVGFEVKDGSCLTDRKLDMHITLRACDRQYKKARSVDMTGAFESLLDSIPLLIEAAVPAARTFAMDIEEQFSEQGFVQDVLDAKDEWMVRLLNYPPGTPAGEMLAIRHPDKGGFTLDGRANHGEMQYLASTNPEVWVKLPPLGHSLAVMAGICLQERLKCRITAPYHRVVSTADSALFGRRVIVIFIDFKNTRYFNKKKYGSQQKMPVAYNYGVDAEEFSRRHFID